MKADPFGSVDCDFLSMAEKQIHWLLKLKLKYQACEIW